MTFSVLNNWQPETATFWIVISAANRTNTAQQKGLWVLFPIKWGRNLPGDSLCEKKKEKWQIITSWIKKKQKTAVFCSQSDKMNARFFAWAPWMALLKTKAFPCKSRNWTSLILHSLLAVPGHVVTHRLTPKESLLLYLLTIVFSFGHFSLPSLLGIYLSALILLQSLAHRKTSYWLQGLQDKLEK